MDNAITNPKTKIHPSCVPLYILIRAGHACSRVPEARGVGHGHGSPNEVSMLLIHPMTSIFLAPKSNLLGFSI